MQFQVIFFLQCCISQKDRVWANNASQSDQQNHSIFTTASWMCVLSVKAQWTD